MAAFLDSKATRLLNLLNITSLGLGKLELGNTTTHKSLEIYLSILISTYKDRFQFEFDDEGNGIELENISKLIYSDNFKNLIEQIEVDKITGVLESILNKKQNVLPATNKVHKKIKYSDTSIKGVNQATTLLNLKVLINRKLAEQIAKNMGDGDSTGVLNYRTGRFATTAYVDNVIMNRDGAIGIFYTYMKYPYQTFEQGFKLGNPASRDPRLLISKSIREIATGIVNNRLRITRQ
jgi:hypothetical protein